MAVVYNRLVVASFTEANVNLRGTNAWGDSYALASGGLQNDITLIAHQFDYGYAPAASGSAILGAQATPFLRVHSEQFTAGAPDSSGGIFLYGNTQVGANNQIYRIQIDNGALVAVAVGALGDGNNGSAP